MSMVRPVGNRSHGGELSDGVRDVRVACTVHRDYTAAEFPREDCRQCWDAYWATHPYDAICNRLRYEAEFLDMMQVKRNAGLIPGTDTATEHTILFRTFQELGI